MKNKNSFTPVEVKGLCVPAYETLKKVTVVIPSYQPDEKLHSIVSGLEDAGFDDIIIVDDGSDVERKHFFPDPAEHPAVTLLVHPQNRGKGAALKTAFRWFLENRPDRAGVITADGDAQHRVEDIIACGGRMLREGNGTMVLGVRDFSLPNVPPRSKAGNRTTSAVFRIFCGLKISDTQTGLRAIPAGFLSDLCRVDGDRYEYETNMLLAMNGLGIEYCEHPIETVYIEENQTSHFRVVRDSLRIYSLILKYIFSSVAAFLIDAGSFYLLSRFLAPHLPAAEVLVCTVIARALSSGVNFIINRKMVFRSGASAGKTFLRYYALAIPVMLVSAGCVAGLKALFSVGAPWLVTLIKIVVDTVLYFVNFRIQREWVFAAGKSKKSVIDRDNDAK
ncbi:MAG: bifunctional glycosyltransferase family 2/GtrA family protein [Clostridia bacterium]|nr:bifunctional glycosyltransferase family 2/GtrA family protein [Clostridia bacterium]